ncbi:DnaB-like helicase N-terminal domain-containing protein [Streptomyces tsukubensis]|uniref:DnaB-like helicase N-terminal domain-containing protein n=1 Tax=Streptomyces tsukubensis TaxID=83656 RepID=UPI003685F53D
MPEPTSGEGLDLDDIPPDPPVHHAEQALLGALLLDPHRLKTIGPLAPEHFASPAHAATFAAMTGLTPPAPAVHAREPVWITAVHTLARERAPGLQPAYLHILVSRCPVPEHAPAYARMVREDHARRTLGEHAGRLAQLATDRAGPSPVSAALAAADTLTRHLEDLSRRFAPHPGSLPRTPLPPEPVREAGDDVLAEERFLLASATAHPGCTARMRWLLPEDLIVPQHAALYHCITALARRGAPVDPVTVLWEAQRHGVLTQHTDPAHVLGLIAVSAGHPDHWGEKVLERTLLHQAHCAAVRVRALADDPVNSPHQLVTGSRRALASLSAVRARLDQATRPTAAPTLPSAVAPRAGPALRTGTSPAASTLR